MLSWPSKKNEAFKYVPLTALKEHEGSKLYNGSIDDQSDIKLTAPVDPVTSRAFSASITHLAKVTLKPGLSHLELECPSDCVINPHIELALPPKTEAMLVLNCNNKHARSWINLTLDLNLGEGSSLTVVSSVSCSQGANYTVDCHTNLAEQAQIFWNHCVIKGSFSHFSNHISLSEKSHASFKSCILASDASYHGFQPKVTHRSPMTTCDIQTRGLAFDKSTILQHGTIYVPENSAKIEAHYSSDNLILGSGAKVFARPDLDIHCDDVVCSHGVTFGSIDKEQVFYLQARNLDEHAARLILLKAFIFKLLNEFPPAVSLSSGVSNLAVDVENRLLALLGE